MSNLVSNHGIVLKQVLRYLNDTKELEILYKKIPKSLVLKTGIDSSGNENPNDEQSTHEHLGFMGDSIEGRSSKQNFVALSSTETEYMSQASAATNVMGARKILQEMNIASTVPEAKNDQMNDQNDYKDDQTDHIEDKTQIPTIIYADNQEAIKLTNNPVFQKRIKHIAIKYHYTRDLINQKKIRLKYLSHSGDDSGRPDQATRIDEFQKVCETARNDLQIGINCNKQK